MRSSRIFFTLALFFLIFSLTARAQLLGVFGGGVSCAQGTTLSSRLSASANTAANTNAICGMVSDGTWSSFLAFWVMSAANVSDAETNWVSSSFTLSPQVGPSFVPWNGWSPNGSTQYINTTLTPSTSGLTVNNMAMGFCDHTSNNTALTQMGSSDASNSTLLGARGSTPALVSRFNNAIGTTNTDTLSNTNASWHASRSASGSYSTYQNGNLLSSHGTASSGLPTAALALNALNNNGTITNFVSDSLGWAYVGTALTQSQIQSVYNRMHSLELAVGTINPC